MNIKERILFEDNNLLIVDKPAGIPVHKTVDRNRPVLEDYLRIYLQGNYLGILHRLDKDTSGVMIFSKNQQINPYLAELFSARQVEKKYLAITDVAISPEQGRMEDFVKEAKVGKGRGYVTLQTKVISSGKKAILDYQLLQTQTRAPFYLYEIKLVTGRMHQIRAQFKFRGAPLVGDLLYGNCTQDDKKRLMLHCASVKFLYQEQELIVASKTPGEFLALME
ncbi:MAG: hypothetical protein A2504_01895 [Bdellovibrionales bacterium RIFOXYD12_FULL_39_22]|nr:MAG: hypothetical protein A2385_04420 [Bdellovibrionales bacterium RIFOXYB1_FULL_39_21]OFZ42341.1 MAG: hypothetical protein A2485_15075 [Bdellovibrionales bacterium RIFOXYC12_FULL_39_17]OFZ46358.1 MAG: hypothetical protein A2404_13940 [Bdellovibrionales bacterium RIFOXYC1_FULL_39_130]OFZ75251.1 MAG: hypothetical protein A2560_15995 [Bdellovibrionales bacterium RIFOXYD1_FULL_39_84]OFZ93245.1 MAG: hypothetical protein A2504_01895 [Bdellovibrionales bacterium RIFOXYD12_FULL_39_22]HLE11045.1 RN